MVEVSLLALLLLIVVLLAVYTFRVKAGKAGHLRQIAGFQRLGELVAQSAETGRPLHVSVGVAGVGGAATAETWAGFALLGQLADDAAAHGIPLLVTVSDATALPIAQDIVCRAYSRHGGADRACANQVRLIAPLPSAYAAGAMGLLMREPLAGNIMVGSFGDEYLLIGDAGVRRGHYQVVGATDPQTLALMRVSADDTLVGEEIFAGGAYAPGRPIQIASLLAEDWLRWLLVAGILVAAIWRLVT